MIADLETAFLRVCPSFEAQRARMRDEHGFKGEAPHLATVLDQLGYHLGSIAQHLPSEEMLQVLKVIERVLADGNEQQKWAVTHFLMPSLQSSIREKGNSPDALLAHLGPATRSWWNDLTINPSAARDW